MLLLLLKLQECVTKPVTFQLKSGVSPYYGKVIPVSQVHEATLHRKVERLVELVVLNNRLKANWLLIYMPQFHFCHYVELQ